MNRPPPKSTLSPSTTLSRSLGRRGPPLAREAIEVARGVGALEIDGGREPAPLDRERADARLNRSARAQRVRSEEHTSELQSRLHLVCRLLLEKKNKSDENIK